MRAWLFAAVAAFVSGSAALAQPPVALPPVPDTQPTSVTCPDTGKSKAIGTGHVATATRGFIMQSTGNYWLSSCPNNQNCNNGTGSFRADLGFAFGPSKSFFEPCGPRIFPDCGGAGKLGSGCKSCRTPILGHGPCGPWPHCTYDSYLNH